MENKSVWGLLRYVAVPKRSLRFQIKLSRVLLEVKINFSKALKSSDN